jgi:two-component system response regulator (stage 0 sporulation protein F)
MKILVVDDEEGARDLFNTILTDEGYEVSLANGGEEALDLLKSHPFIRKMGSKTDVIMVTAYGEVESYLKAMSLGAAEYINKPIRIKELKQIVHKVLTEQRARSGN